MSTDRLEHIRVEKFRLDDLKLLSLNARFMAHDQFHRLVDNIRRDGQLTSVPFAWRDADGNYLVLSGNHRVQAAIVALGEDHEAFVMLCDDPMPRDRAVALQLAHNAIAGQDDPSTLKQLYEEVSDVDWRTYSGLDDKTLALLDEVTPESLSEANLEYQTISIALLPDEKERAIEAWKDMRAELVGSSEVWAAKFADADRLLDALDVAGRSYGVSSIAVCLGLLLDLLERNVEQLRDAYLLDGDEARQPKGKVPVVTLFGYLLPGQAAANASKVIRHMKDSGDIEESWQALDRLNLAYLAGLEAEKSAARDGSDPRGDGDDS